VHGLDGEEVGVPGAREVNAERDADEEDGYAGEDVGDGVEGRDEGRAKVARDDAPVLFVVSAQAQEMGERKEWARGLTRDSDMSP